MSEGLLSDTEIYKNTYADLVLWVKELHWLLQWQKSLNNNNTELKHAQTRDKLLSEREEYNRRLSIENMNLKLALRRYSAMMVEDRQDTIEDEYARYNGDVINLAEYKAQPRRKTGGGYPPTNADYLSKMEWGTQFFVRPRMNKTWLLAKFLHAGTRKGVILLVPMRGAEDTVSDDREWVPVDPVTFCEYWELFEKFPPAKFEMEDE